MDKFMKIAILLTATDQMSNVVNGAVKNSMAAFTAFETGKFAAQAMWKPLEAGVDAAADLEESGNKLKAVMMGKDGIFNEGTYKQIEGFSQQLSSKYAQSAKDYIDMIRVFKANRVSEKDVLFGGIGEEAAKLADYFDQMHPGAIALFASRMKNDFSVTPKEMPQMMDLLARLKDSGVGAGDPNEAVHSMTEMFSKASIGLANLKSIGFQATKELGVVGGYFLSRGLRPEMVGTNLRRMFDTVRSTERMKQMSDAAKEMGISFEFFNKDHSFKGMKNFVTELDKMRGLTPQQIDAITSKPFGGKMGFSSDMVNFLAQYGTDKFKEFEDDVNRQATLDKKVVQIMDGWNYVVKVFKSSWETLKQVFGTGFLPLLKDFGIELNSLIVKTRDFLSEHPNVSKFIGAFMAFGGAAFLVKGLATAIGFAENAMIGLSMSMTLTPIGWMLAGVTALALVFSNWDTELVTLNGHAITVGETIWNIIKPIEQLIALGLQLGAFSSGVLSPSLGVYAASYAAEIDRMDAKFANGPGIPSNNNSGSGIGINYSPTINVAGVTTTDVAQQLSEQNRRDFDRIMKDYEQRQKRTNFK